MDIIKKNFGEQLKILRKIKNYTQETLSEAIGINLRQLARIEAGESFVSSDTLFKICKALDISPKALFNFSINESILMTGTGNYLHFNVTKDNNVLHFSFKENNEIDNLDNKAFESKILTIAQRVQKEIFVDVIENGIKISSKIYTPKGEIKTANEVIENNFENLKNKLTIIANDKKKVEYMNLAFESLQSKEALNELKILIKGIELTQD